MTRAIEIGPDELRAEIERILRLLASYVERRCRSGAHTSSSIALACEQAADHVVQLVGTQPPPRIAAEPPWAMASPGLACLASVFGLSRCEYDAFITAAAAELVPGLGRLLGHLNDQVSSPRPTVGLALDLAAAQQVSVPTAVAFVSGPLVREGLVVIEGEGPLVERELRIVPEVLEAVTARRRPIASAATDHERLDQLVLGEDVRRRVERWCSAPAEPLVIAGKPGSGRRTVVHAAAARIGRSVVMISLEPAEPAASLRSARREARWHDALLLLRIDRPVDDWTRVWTELADIRPFAIAVEPEVVDDLVSRAPAGTTVVALDEPDAPARVELFRTLLPTGHGVSEQALESLGQHFRFTPGRIALAIRRAVTESTATGTALEAGHVLAACRVLGQASMGPLAERLPLPFHGDDLIVPPNVREELDLALAWVRHAPLVQGQWGFRARLATGRGLVAMFSGPPGTGKTMAAQVMARELDLDLYRIDLSRVVSKWVGDTEKHLARLFDESHASGAMLFFDEAEALFGRRSAVKQSNDRYANIEVGYLLQRIEMHDGIVILASNRAADLDPAFFRRIHVTIEFPMPSALERHRIWRRFVPPEAIQTDEATIDAIAERIALSGGEIRNAVLAAAYRAAAAGDSITTSHLAWAVKREVRRSGRVLSRQDWVGIDGTS